jgi:hypothetical protein
VQTCRAPSNRTWPSVSTSSTYDGHLPKQELRSSLTRLALLPAVAADFAPDEEEAVVEQAANAKIVNAILVSMSAQRLAVQLRARRRVGTSMILRCPCGGIVSCNGMFGSPS